MTTDYQPVQKALADGAEPAMLCATCPWDRPCVTPPVMTSGEIDARMTEALRQDEAELAAGAGGGARGREMPVRTLLAAVTFGGKDTAAQVCPVFALRLRSSTGRDIADSVRSTMKNWDDAK